MDRIARSCWISSAFEMLRLVRCDALDATAAPMPTSILADQLNGYPLWHAANSRVERTIMAQAEFNLVVHRRVSH